MTRVSPRGSELDFGHDPTHFFPFLYYTRVRGCAVRGARARMRVRSTEEVLLMPKLEKIRFSARPGFVSNILGLGTAQDYGSRFSGRPGFVSNILGLGWVAWGALGCMSRVCPCALACAHGQKTFKKHAN